MPSNHGHLAANAVGGQRWETLSSERTVLAVVRTLTSAIRLLDALPLIGTDFRIDVRFAFDNSSAFSAQVPDFLRAAGIQFTPWSTAITSRFDLAVMASENIEIEDLDAPIVVLPHGTGFHRYVPDSAGPGYRLAGVVPARRLASRPVSIAIPHPDQQAQLAAEYPEAAARCVVVGDLVFDRLTASLPLRDYYRRALGVRPGQRLVMVTSTWGDGSLFKSWPRLVARLLGELPVDEYRVALVLHPNIWTEQGDYLLRLRLDDARQAGLLLMPPAGGWQAALIAADVVVGDHGSVTLYGAALDRPVLLTGDLGAARVVTGTAPHELARIADRLDADLPLVGQVAAAIEGHKPGELGTLADRMFARQGEATLALRDLLYDTLRLPVPATVPAIHAIGEPRLERSSPGSFLVYSMVGPEREVSLWRFPATTRDPGSAGVADAGLDAMQHLCVDEAEPDRRRPGNASVIVRQTVTGLTEADAWLAETFRRYPGCRVTATPVPDGCLAGLRDGQRIHVTAPGADSALAGSAIYAWLQAGEQPHGPVTLRTGTRSVSALLTQWPP